MVKRLHPKKSPMLPPISPKERKINGNANIPLTLEQIFARILRFHTKPQVPFARLYRSSF